MAFDFKKEYKEFYLPGKKPSLVTVPPMNYLAVRVKGDPNVENSEYKQSIPLLYAVAYTIKMSKKGDHRIDGYFDFVVPPLEGFWWQEGGDGMDFEEKDRLRGISAIRLPDFVGEADFAWAIEEATRKKGSDFSQVAFLRVEEGLCVQCMHIGPYDDEPATVALMDDHLERHGYVLDIGGDRHHHEIYLSDVRKVEAAKWKTVLRQPIKAK